MIFDLKVPSKLHKQKTHGRRVAVLQGGEGYPE
jgi:hypothetical protein